MNDPVSWGQPAFAKDFPKDDELERLVTAFARGDYATVRKGAPKLASSTNDEAVKAAAQTLRERIEPDPTSKLLLGLGFVLLAFLTGWWVTHDGPEGNGAFPSKVPVIPAPKVEHVD